MAYTRQKEAACPVLSDPGVVSAYIPISTGETNVPVRVPWNNCKLVYAYTTFVSNEAAAGLDGGDCTLKLELDAADGTELMGITIANAAAVGDVDEGTVSSDAACSGLTNQSTVNVSVDGHASTTLGGFNIYLYFEPDDA
jgi:hypothetical protein